VQADHINPFVNSLVTTLSKMLSCEARRGKIALATNGQRYYPISGVIGLSGNAAGAVVINLSEEFALRAASHLLMADCTEITPDVIDVVGELTNVVAGHAKTQLAEFEMSVSLPNVITGEGHTINFPTAAPGLSVPFETDFGPLRLEVGLEVVAACV
jgi:chemotaxis protein CheX